MVIGNALAEVINRLKNSGNDNPYFEAHLIFRTVLKLSSMDLVLGKNKEISYDDLKLINEYTARRTAHEPLQYILKSQEFMGFEFYVDENVLVPRQDTEVLVEKILEHFGGKGFTGIDIGTGSGCIAISLAKINPNVYMTAVDISADALEIARKNAQSNLVFNRINFIEADIFSFKPFGKYDLVVSNPPYIKSDEILKLQQDVKAFEPTIALDGGESGLIFYERIVEVAPNLLNKGGMLAFEIGYDQGEKVKNLMQDVFTDVKVVKDLCGLDRVIIGFYK